MTDLTRRTVIGLLGATSALSICPVQLADAAEVAAQSPSHELLALRDKVQDILDAFDAKRPFEINQYSQVFDFRPNSLPVETVVRGRLIGERRFERRQSYSFPAEHVELGFAVGGGEGPDHVRTMLTPLTQSFLQLREIDAADVFNAATRYDAVIGGDGVAMCADNHPCDTHAWSNLLQGSPLSAANALAASSLALSFVDEAGLKIHARPQRLIVPIAQMAVAERLTKTELRPGTDDDEMLAIPHAPLGAEPYFAWDYLADNHAWFVTTNVKGLTHFEHQPFSLRAVIDRKAEKVLVIGHEARKFGCSDPRAIIGAVPHGFKPRLLRDELGSLYTTV